MFKDDELSNVYALCAFHCSQFPRDQIRKKLESMDKAYHMILNKEISKKDSKDEITEYSKRYGGYDLPLVRKQLQSEIPFLEDIFLGETQVFRIDPTKLPKGLLPIADSINKEVELDSETKEWRQNISRFLANGAKYNLCGMDVFTSRKMHATLKFSETAAIEPTTEEWKGQAMVALDPYNMVFDTVVNPEEVSTIGEFSGYVERYSATRLMSLYRDLENMGNDENSVLLHLCDQKDLWDTNVTRNGGADANNMDYYIPNIVDGPTKKKDFGWIAFTREMQGLKMDDDNKVPNAGTSYDILKIYIRVIPATLAIKLDNVPDSANYEPQIWAVYIRDGNFIIGVVAEENASGLIPAVVVAPDRDNLGIQGKSSLECTAALQQLGADFIARRMASLDRSIDDRALVDDRYLDESKFRSRVPDAKITPKAAFKSARNTKLSDIYQPIDFRDISSGLIGNEIAFIMQLAQDTNLSNASRVGQFAKGNKTPDEVRITMANAEAPLLRRALQFELQGFRQIKTILQYAYMQEGDFSQYLPDRDSELDFSPKTLLSSSFAFKLAGGLDPLTIAMKSGLLNELFNLASTVPSIGDRYDIGQLFTDIYYSRGLDLERYKLPTDPNSESGQGGGGSSEQ